MSTQPDGAAGSQPRPSTVTTSHLLRTLTVSHLDAVVAIEKACYPFPWTRGNFIDSLAAGYEAQVLLDPQVKSPARLLGYWVAMPGVDEMHLLNITVAPEYEGRGYARFMLDALIRIAQSRGDQQLWLEVRPSNHRARDLYIRYGFRQVGVRKGYYPAALGRREDALVMSYQIAGVAP
ncbi:ribosomal protein S18-alanine N-acetyltransferase [soil metagenome]